MASTAKAVSWSSLFLVLLSHTHFSTAATLKPVHLEARSDCSTVTVASGDGCGSLANKCGISGSDFTKYNSDPNLCSNLQPGQSVCCSSGTLPDKRPRQNGDGTCASYTVQSGDTCSGIAAANGLKVADLATFNDKTTWGWAGCASLFANINICLSSGSPPLPQAVSNAICGPIKPGTQTPPAGTDLSTLNPCPLNACCNKWGQCGVTPDFCTAETGPTGNPGTAPNGRNGCISNCGTTVTNLHAPAAPINVGYYESWNWDRLCANMLVDSLDTTKYTHYHWAFANIDPNSFYLTINDTYGEWNRFLNMQGVKRIVSIGGWSFSTDPGTYNILRQAMRKPKDFALNIIFFLNIYGLDGIDIDWEYPGAHDTVAPPADPSDGLWYLYFLYFLRQNMPAGKTISIAAPASYWYLQNFPIKAMAQYVDYIVYMTYDLHGQWDYNNQWTDDGCPAGNCLRSHVNITETAYALAMITKAGVPSNQIVVGVSSYGRAFKMTDSSCTGPMCTYTGPASGAIKGFCTQTAGYISNAEINAYKAFGVPSTYDSASGSDWLIINGDTWVSYMTDDTKRFRQSIYNAYLFAGTADWAVDLQQLGDRDSVYGDPNNEDLEDAPEADGTDGVYCDAMYTNMDDLDRDAGTFPDACAPLYSVQALAGEFNVALQNYSRILANDYDNKFHTYAQAVSDHAGQTLNDYMRDHGNDYFSCIITEIAFACSCCSTFQARGDPCRGCFSGDCSHQELSARDLSFESYNSSALEARDRPHQVTVYNTAPFNISEPCPPDLSQRGYGSGTQTIYWSLRSDKADQFYADLTANAGFNKDKTQIGNRYRTAGQGCPGGSYPGDGNVCWNNDWDINYPILNNFGPGDVANPKDTVTKALSNSNDLQNQLYTAMVTLEFMLYQGDFDADLVDAVSTPVLAVMEAISQMQTVEDTADQIEEAKRKAIIAAIFGALLFFIPIAGEALGAITGVAEIAAITATLGAVGDAAMGIYGLATNDGNPMGNILSLIMAPLSLLNVAKVGQAANIRRGMSDAQVGKLGARFTKWSKIAKKTCPCA